MLDEVPDLVEYPVVVSGGFAQEFLQLPEEVLTTTMIHHQHFFPIVDDQGKLMPVFLAVLNMQPEQPDVISRNMERVLTARLRDARFFFDADREKPLADYVERLGTVLFHKKLGTYQEKSARVQQLARWICADVFGRSDVADIAAEAGTALQGRPRHRHGARADRAAGHDRRHLRARGRPARGSVEGDLLPLPAGRR